MLSEKVPGAKSNTSRCASQAYVCLIATVVLMMASTVLLISPVSAEPYIAIQEGYKCSKCHVNMTGGGKRTGFGNIFSQTLLLQAYVNWKRPGVDAEEGAEAAETPTSSFFSGQLNDFISVGGDFRGVYQLIDTPNQNSRHEFNVEKSVVYFQVDLIPERVLFYWTAPGGGDAREIFGLIKGSASNFYIKVGQFFLPYGFRLQDDSAFIRSATGFTYKKTDVGMEMGIEPGPLSLNLAVTNGTGDSGDTNQNKRVTFRGSIVGTSARVGASYSKNTKEDGSRSTAHDIFAGFHFGRFNLLAEIDRIAEEDATRAKTNKLAGLAEINFLLTRGINLKLSYDFLDPDEGINEDERERYSLVYESFPVQFTQVRMGLRVNEGIPQNDEQNAKELFFEFHIFF